MEMPQYPRRMLRSCDEMWSVRRSEVEVLGSVDSDSISVDETAAAPQFDDALIPRASGSHAEAIRGLPAAGGHSLIDERCVAELAAVERGDDVVGSQPGDGEEGCVPVVALDLRLLAVLPDAAFVILSVCRRGGKPDDGESGESETFDVAKNVNVLFLGASRIRTTQTVGCIDNRFATLSESCPRIIRPQGRKLSHCSMYTAGAVVGYFRHVFRRVRFFEPFS